MFPSSAGNGFYKILNCLTGSFFVTKIDKIIKKISTKLYQLEFKKNEIQKYLLLSLSRHEALYGVK